MNIPRLSLAPYFARLVNDQRGVSSVEFAMLLPLMITLYLGAVEISQGVGIDRKVTLTTRTVADLASQVSSINNADMTNLLNASAAVIVPYDTSQLKVTVSEITIDNTGTAKITWSDTLNGTKRAVGSTVSLPLRRVTLAPSMGLPASSTNTRSRSLLHAPPSRSRSSVWRTRC